MGFLNIALAAFLLLSLHVQTYQASRILSGDLYSKELVLQSLPRGPVPPSGASGCTHIPNTGGPSCPNTVNTMNVAGHVLSPTGAFPRLMVEFGVATTQK